MTQSAMDQIKKKPAKHGRKREVILDGALAHISRHGLENTGLKEIAAHLGMTHPALYYYFSSKDELVFEAVRKAMRGLIDALSHSQTGLSENAELRLMALCQAHVQHELVRGQEVSFVNAFIYGPLRNSSSLDELARSEIKTLQREVVNHYRTIIRDGQKTGDFLAGDATVLTFGVLGIVSYAVSWFRADGELEMGAAAQMLAAQALRSVKISFGHEKI